MKYYDVLYRILYTNVLFQLTFTTLLGDRYYYYPHFIAEEPYAHSC